MHNGELYTLYPSQNVILVPKYVRIRWTVHVACLEEKGSTYRILVGRFEGSRLFARPERRWEDNIKLERQEIERGRIDWIDTAEDRDRWQTLVNAVMNLLVP